ncbi:hypothetical protein [Caulobacter sp. Root1472]|uniref:hypothetical protein n=1 Tax=Caulobacter sp. Root1472 TaxID=1736470 RepID=UPI0006FBC177|nr:hypothetical protein [Caulobacter sp. Root1472]KQZ22894.1 hypothetical protein ASD47_24260 [Caulobacter sp. Root1472]
MTDSKPVTPLEPFLMRYPTDRLGEPTIHGRYCEVHQVWLVVVDGVEQPIIKTDRANSEIQTKTKVQVEDDDDDWGLSLELATKTRVRVEEDDEEIHGLGLLEIATKTFAQIERDDEEDIQGLEGRSALDFAA